MDVKVKGVVITLDGEEYVLPPLPLRRISEVRSLMEGGDPMTNPEFVMTLVRAIVWSLERNYPDIKIEAIQDSIDMTNYGTVVAAFTEANGFVNKSTVAGEAPGSQ